MSNIRIAQKQELIERLGRGARRGIGLEVKEDTKERGVQRM